MNVRQFLRGGRGHVAAPPRDTTPDAFSLLAPGSTFPLNSYASAGTFAPAGFNANTTIEVSGGGEYKIENGDWSSTRSTLSPLLSVDYRVWTGSQFNADVPNALTIGGVSASMAVHTASADTTPDPITYTPVTGADLLTHYPQSFTLSGTEATTSFSTSGGATISLDAGATFETSGSIAPGASFIIDMFSSSSYEALARGIVNIGGLEIVCDVTTKVDPSPTPTPTPPPTDIPTPKVGAADITVDFTGATTASARQTRIKDAMAAALLEMQGAADPANHPLKIAIPQAAIGSIFFNAGDFPSQLSVVPVDYANPPTFWRFAMTGGGLNNVLFDGFKTDMTATNGGLTTFTQVISFTRCNKITLSNWQVNVGGPIGNLLNVRGCEDFLAYRCEFVGGYQHTAFLGQRVDTAPDTPSLRPRLIQCSFRGSREDFIRPWGATDFLIDSCYIGDGYRNSGGQHADGIQIAQAAAPNSNASSGVINNCIVISRNGPDQTSGIFMSDNNVPYNDVRFTNNTIIGCDLNSICMRGVASGGVITGNKCYAVDFNMFTPAGTRIMAKMLVTGSGSGAVGVTLQNNQSYLYGDDTSTFAVREVPTSTGMNLGTDPAAIQPIVDDWLAANPDVPLNTTNFAAVLRGY